MPPRRSLPDKDPEVRYKSPWGMDRQRVTCPHCERQIAVTSGVFVYHTRLSLLRVRMRCPGAGERAPGF